MKHRTTREIVAVSALCGAMAAPTIAEDLYLAADAGVIWRFDTTTGVVDHPVSCGGVVQGLAVQGREVFAAASDNSIYKIDLETGAFVGAWPTNGSPLSLTRWGNTLYLTTEHGDMQWLNADDLSTIDTYYVNDPLHATVLFGNTIFTGSWSTFVYTAPIGELDFEFFTACGGRVNSMTTDGTDLIIGSVEGTVYVFDAQTGVYERTFVVASDCAGIAYADERLFIAGSDGRIHRMHPGTGQIEQVYVTGMGITAMTAGEGCAADFNGDGSINALDFLAYLNAWGAGDGSADMDGNGVLNVQDILVFLNEFTSGCN